MDHKHNDPAGNGDRNPDGKRPKNRIVFTLIIAIAIVLLISGIYNAISSSQYTHTTYTDFLNERAAGNLAEVEFQFDRVIYMTKTEAEKNPSIQKACYTGLPSGNIEALFQLYQSYREITI